LANATVVELTPNEPIAKLPVVTKRPDARDDRFVMDGAYR
jgi:hypothetical protein